MSEKKRFRLGPAVVNINTMKPELAENVINICNAALRCAIQRFEEPDTSRKSNQFCLLDAEITSLNKKQRRK